MLSYQLRFWFQEETCTNTFVTFYGKRVLGDRSIYLRYIVTSQKTHMHICAYIYIYISKPNIRLTFFKLFWMKITGQWMKILVVLLYFYQNQCAEYIPVVCLAQKESFLNNFNIFEFSTLNCIFQVVTCFHISCWYYYMIGKLKIWFSSIFINKLETKRACFHLNYSYTFVTHLI